jgi:sn-glycerol 3-phosphate transport system ATP-binding protein
MNLLTGSADAARFAVGTQQLALAAAAPRAGALTLGVRPEHADIRPDGAWSMQVEMLEMLGAERLVYGRLGDSPFTLRMETTRTPPRPGEAVPVHVAAEHLHWFDAAGGRRVG